ncbi:MAG: metal ABC transporter permease [Raoultibacter sp.]|jgi:zinc transport system permease protein
MRAPASSEVHDSMELMLDKLVIYLEYPFVRYALIVGVLIALCSSLFGATLVLKRFSFIGDGLSHVAFGAVAIAAVLNLSNNMLLVAPVTIVFAVLLLRTGQNAKVKGDAALAMLSVGALAVGYMLMNIFPTSTNLSGDVCTTLFGSTSILTLSTTDVWTSLVMSIVVIGLFLLFYHKIFAVTFDEDFAKATGTKTNLYNLLIAVVIALIIVLAMQLVGALLISALVVFPALSAMRLVGSFKSVILCSAIISVVCASAGMLISILASTPVGATIVIVNIVVFGFCYLLGFLTGVRR